ncbi:hypothetical protein SDRG_16617 [Saprolegnia diclina VS20]|uniref:Uncharacterized protein n=1 Tax=Saprolegnia diclina (strain VS20) TaxID=1156394 RepID=T0PWX2_SAPDV|nr:hypothetical protein SDRG_16616 [Saprolegnia diclina VS20]XP_008621055.1 hypothetical protein SDRG_16617 [Saprolegnia diclina VS20]EQC25510.1 hypothetical protein SDRG_16616 [Saprolegnia diclina VS20]EQC25511.1 hypothetical protein SDRG_16617 [Saprolegnia diclina VS20]|eukprot:XP_008621054.1 hypothetical protein SDRG_16616 [Saprolegnia diclina VS20]
MSQALASPHVISSQVKPVAVEAWPLFRDLAADMSVVHMRIGLIERSDNAVRIRKKLKLKYHSYAVALAFAVATWKA